MGRALRSSSSKVASLIRCHFCKQRYAAVQSSSKNAPTMLLYPVHDSAVHVQSTQMAHIAPKCPWCIFLVRWPVGNNLCYASGMSAGFP